MMLRLRTMLTVALLAVPVAAHAQATGHNHGTATAADTAATRAYKQAAERMHRDMAIRYTNDPDRDFVAGMIAHHQGAIDMAKVALQHGRDPEIRKLAQDVVTAQEKEIVQMREWLAKRR